MEKITLDRLMGGAVREQFTKAFDRVLENMVDPNTSYKKVRKIKVELAFSQNELRNDVKCDVSVSTSLADQTPMTTNFDVGIDMSTGKVYASEYGRHNQLKGQTHVDFRTGEVLDDMDEPVVEDDAYSEQSGVVVDMRMLTVANR